ncbi:hypothetical protein [Maricaulis sp.]|jgi:hypothetical protein|uniref:hypothetical protein n=1 Tax=Maricaulis sp. TaxID=1486257 RepID=UPI00262AC637|nr:hypothetical protein [Maricaulis sp.]MDF1768154.1 hypothetical protein [Maricaulis sp.]
MNTDTETLRLAMRIHQDLSAAIAPATPGTIRASELRHNRVLLSIGAIGLAALLLLVVMNAIPAFWGAGGEGAPPAADGLSGEQISQKLTRLCSAVLGATLFAFWTARNYLRDGTFRPQYYQLYLLRFVLGIFTGFILGEIAGGNSGLNGIADEYGPLAIAVVGGFSAEAVVQILQRIADILVAAVRGNEREQAQSDAQAETRRRLNEASARMQDALAESDPDVRAAALREVAAQLRER